MCSTGAACVVGQIAAVGSLTGCDAAVHMSEEVKDASRTVRKMMMATIALNGIMGFAITIMMSFVIQDVKEQIVESTAYYPVRILMVTAPCGLEIPFSSLHQSFHGYLTSDS